MADHCGLPFPTTTGLAELGSMIGDPSRASMLNILLDGRARTARELADGAGVSPQTASTHIAKLVGCGLVSMQKQGRHRYHRLASADVAHMLEALHLAVAELTPAGRKFRPGPNDASMRVARSCYDHLAGRAGVRLAEALSRGGHIRLDFDTGEVTESGIDFFKRLGVDLPPLVPADRSACRPCIDWSERRPHIAGAVGSSLLEHFLSVDWLRRRTGTRALAITPSGRQGFSNVFGISSLED